MKKVSNKNTIFYPNVPYVKMELNFNFPMNESLKFLLVCFFSGKIYSFGHNKNSTL